MTEVVNHLDLIHCSIKDAIIAFGGSSASQILTTFTVDKQRHFLGRMGSIKNLNNWRISKFPLTWDFSKVNRDQFVVANEASERFLLLDPILDGNFDEPIYTTLKDSETNNGRLIAAYDRVSERFLIAYLEDLFKTHNELICEAKPRLQEHHAMNMAKRNAAEFVKTIGRIR